MKHSIHALEYIHYIWIYIPRGRGVLYAHLYRENTYFSKLITAELSPSKLNYSIVFSFFFQELFAHIGIRLYLIPTLTHIFSCVIVIIV